LNDFIAIPCRQGYNNSMIDQSKAIASVWITNAIALRKPNQRGYLMNTITRSPQSGALTVTSPQKIYKFAIIIESVDNLEKERHSLTAYFNEPPFPFEIDEWTQSITGNDYRVVDSFPLEEISL
jgi:hypothetical protein